ncbi:FAD-binding protein [Amycolatopsis alkalitolerans]|uniref:FAD-binding protein n=1 Tax=Amycolatopsis alkalitolerans TaxID=2547244 RepID=A0A5C4LXD0_9PSEU|nr:FAD-binding protein [Amycolatopsis alkalitolerans]TNC24206.1 FAD-binding protein [Amycolatopsis alkalitolerans]
MESSDFGGIVATRPREVRQVSSIGEVHEALRDAAGQRIPVLAHGRRHTSFGQSQIRDGVSLDMTGLNQIHEFEEGHVVVEAGATWAEVLRATLAHGRTPRVLTDYLGVTVGGTLSAGGIGGTSGRRGVQTDNVLALEVITGDGVRRTCSRTESPELFDGVLAGFGRCGVIVRATVPLGPAPARVRRFKIYCPTPADLLRHQRRLLREGRFAFLQGEILPGEHGWTPMLDVAAYYSPPDEPDDARLLAGLGYEPSRDETADLAYWDFANRLADAEAYLSQTGEWFAPHPWSNLFLPDNAADGHVAGVLSVLRRDDLGEAGLVLVYPVFRRYLNTPLFAVPDGEVVFLVAVLRFTSTGDVDRMLKANRAWYDQAVAAGGTAYPVGAVPDFDWARHLAPAAAARDRYDPHGALGSREL